MSFNIKEMERIYVNYINCQIRLANDDFLNKAPAAIVERERQKEKDFAAILEIMKASLISVLQDTYSGFNLQWLIEEMRAANNENYSFRHHVIYSPEWFAYVYNEEIGIDDYIELYKRSFENL